MNYERGEKTVENAYIALVFHPADPEIRPPPAIRGSGLKLHEMNC